MRIVLAVIAEAVCRAKPAVKAAAWVAALLWASWSMADGVLSVIT